MCRCGDVKLVSKSEKIKWINKEKGKVKGRKAFKIMGVVSVELGGKPFGQGPIRKTTWNNWKHSTLWEQNGSASCDRKGAGCVVPQRWSSTRSCKGVQVALPPAGKGGHSHVGFVVQRGSVVFAICREKGGDSLCCARRAWSWICMRMRRVSRECNCVKSLKYICVSLCDCIGHLSKVDLLSIFEFWNEKVN